MAEFWDEWRGSLDGRPTMWIKRLLRLGRWRVDLHKFVGADDPGCFHTHPAYAIRIVLWGGYEEELLTPPVPYFRIWAPGNVGLIVPRYCHRVSRVLNGRASYSLWLRGTPKHDVRLLGDGWAKQRHTAEGDGDPYNPIDSGAKS